VRPLRALERRWGSGLGSRARDGGTTHSAVLGRVEGAGATGAGPHLPIPMPTVNCFEIKAYLQQKKTKKLSSLVTLK
jgi:hypothetical protein